MTKAGDEILAGLHDAVAYMQGDKSRGRAHMIMNSKINVKAIREKVGMTQQKFADTYGLSIHSLRKWEAGIRDPEGAAKAYLTIIAQGPDVVKKMLWQAV